MGTDNPPPPAAESFECCHCGGSGEDPTDEVCEHCDGSGLC